MANEKILVVDDDKNICELLRLYLEKEGFAVTMAYDGNAALQEFEKCAEEENVHYAAGLNSLAALLYAEGDFTKALALYRKSAAYTKRFFGENVEYAITFQNMSWIYKRLGRESEARAALVKAGKIYEALLGPDHERTRAVTDDLKRMQQAHAR